MEWKPGPGDQIRWTETHNLTSPQTGRFSFTEVDAVAEEPGIYLVYANRRIGWLNWDPRSGVAYVGKADDGLRRRLVKEHAGDTGRSTLRRSLGSILKTELELVARPRPSRGEPKRINFINFNFEPDGNDRLNVWMGEHLEVECLLDVMIAEAERRLIAEHQPPLNLTGWENPFALEIKAARAECAEEARLRRLAGGI